MKKYATNIVPANLGSSDASSNTAQAHVFGDSKPKLKSRPLGNRFLVKNASDGKGGYTIQPYQLTPQERERLLAGVDEVKKYTSHSGYRPQSGTVLSDRGDSDFLWYPYNKRKDAYGSGRPVQVASKESRKLAKDSPLAKDILDQSAAQVDAIALPGKEREALIAAHLLERSRGYHRRKAFRDAANNLVGGKLRMSPGEVFPNVHPSALPITLGSMAATDTPEKFRFKDLKYEPPPGKYYTSMEVDAAEKYDPQNFWRSPLDSRARLGADLMYSYLRQGKPSFMGDQVAAGKVPIIKGDGFSYTPFPSVSTRDGKLIVNRDGQINVSSTREELPADFAKKTIRQDTNDYRYDYVDANGNGIPRGQEPTTYGAINDSYDEYEARMHEAVHSRTIPLSRIYADDAKKLDAVFGTGPLDRKPKSYYKEGYADTYRHEFTRATGVLKDALLRDLINSGMSPEEAVRKVQDPQFVKSRLRGIYDNMQDPQLPLTKYQTHSYHYPGTMARDNNAVEVDRAVLGLQPFFQRLLYPGPAGNLVYDMTKDTTKNMPNQRLYERLMDMGRQDLYAKHRESLLDRRNRSIPDPKEVIYNPADTDLLFYDNADSDDNSGFNDKNKYEDFNREISPEELQQAFDIIWPQVRNKELNDRNNNLV